MKLSANNLDILKYVIDIATATTNLLPNYIGRAPSTIDKYAWQTTRNAGRFTIDELYAIRPLNLNFETCQFRRAASASSLNRIENG